MSRDPSLDRNLNGKWLLDQAPASAADIRYKAELRDKIQCNKEAKERERWGSPPPWFVEEERRKVVAAAAAPMAPSSVWEGGWARQAGPSSSTAPVMEDHPLGFPTIYGQGPPPPPLASAPIFSGPPEGYHSSYTNPQQDPP